MKYRVFMVSDAEEDLYEMFKYVAISDSVSKAEILIQKLRDNCKRLTEFPNRGHVPPELERIGVLNYREIHHKSYRIIYQVIESNVYISCILDGRRDLQELLERRVLR